MGDHTVIDEPFSVSYYYGPDRRSERYAETMPASSAAEVLASIEAAAEERPVFVKDMAYQAAGLLGPDLLARFRNCFLVRDPAAVVEAWCEQVDLPYLPEALTWEPGMREEWTLWGDWHASTSRSTGFEELRPSPPPPGEDQPRLREAYEQALPVYERLTALALTGR